MWIVDTSSVVDPNPIPGAWKMTKFSNKPWFPAFQESFCIFVAVLRIHDLLGTDPDPGIHASD
jgi:hypothetical protein